LSGRSTAIGVNGVAAGYYPAQYYGTGPLASRATEFDFGGETLGDGSYPAMGSGEFADQGGGRAAYQRNIYFTKPNGEADNARLTASQDWSSSYTINVGSSTAWGEYFYFGGPGTGHAPGAPTAATRGTGLTLTGPAGVRVEDLSLGEVVTILRQLYRQ
jgi:hypothetical protein